MNSVNGGNTPNQQQILFIIIAYALLYTGVM